MSGVRYHRTRRRTERLIASTCSDCGYVSFPEDKRVCPRCGVAPAEFEDVQLSEYGTVRSFVVNHQLPEPFETPQPLAIVDLPTVGEDGGSARVYGLVTEADPDELAIGVTLRARYRVLFEVGDRPVHSFAFAAPRGEDA